MVDNYFWKKRKVAITGHTGFKGSWLSFWLSKLDSQVSGYALAPDTEPSLFNQLNLVSRISHEEGDIRIYENVKKWLKKVQPEIIFHLAAQPLVRRSYREPMNTWQTNVMGTMNLLEAVRSLNIPCSIIVVTTDKVYENREWLYSYRENDTIGGHDPYSSSKAATEMLVSSWRSSFFAESEIKIATARAGNVIGGGDWSEDRLVPDIIRSIIQKNPIILRYPNAVRPWQHVLEPLSGYLQLSEKLLIEDKSYFQSAFNFGPHSSDFRTVQELVEKSFSHWPGSWKDQSKDDDFHEAGLLNLSTDKARSLIGWFPVWDFSESIKRTIDWYRKIYFKSEEPEKMCTLQIKEFLDYKCNE